MFRKLAAGASVIPLTALVLAGCVSQSSYDELQSQYQQSQAENQQLKAQLAQSQAEQKFVVAGDVLFPEGGYQLSPQGQAALNQYVPKLQNLQNAKIVVYGYTDNLPVGPALQRAGVKDNIDLSSRRADDVVAYCQP
jgi:chemotaxis protein MotB